MRSFRHPVAALSLAAVAAAAGMALAAPAAAADPAKGKTVFLRCSVCHSMDPAVKKIGPSLAGVIGRKAAASPGFNFSAAMKNSQIVWSEKSLDAFLAKPLATVPGNKMAFAGLPNQTDRDDVIAYLRTGGK